MDAKHEHSDLSSQADCSAYTEIMSLQSNTLTWSLKTKYQIFQWPVYS